MTTGKKNHPVLPDKAGGKLAADKCRLFLEKTIRRAGKRLLKDYYSFNRADVRLKPHQEIVTKADLASEALIIQAIKKEFPSHSVLSEESGLHEQGAEYLWVIDPLDGTTNFSIHNPLWSVSIALVRERSAVLGAVYVPIHDELFLAVAGMGAYLDGRRLRVSAPRGGKNIHAFCHGHGTRDIRAALRYYRRRKLGGSDCRQLGSAAIELAYIAAGRLESAVIPGANAWDVAAGALLVLEAGGQATDFRSRPWTLASRDLAASNGQVHRETLRLIKG